MPAASIAHIRLRTENPSAGTPVTASIASFYLRNATTTALGASIASIQLNIGPVANPPRATIAQINLSLGGGFAWIYARVGGQWTPGSLWRMNNGLWGKIQ